MNNTELTKDQWENWKKTLDKWLAADGPIAIAGVQYLEPALGKDSVIFPPTYPMPVLRGRTHTVRDGEYRVSVELPPFRDTAGNSDDKSERNAQKEPGYNIDYFGDGSKNICEIDSPQSQANRMEPLFKTLQGGQLVPQVVIDVKGKKVNLLDAGHRAADALVCFSSLCAEFNEAFADAGRGNVLKLARLSPTSLLFGSWDSRSTQTKLGRIIKAQIRATDVQLLTRSAQFTPATDYVQSGAIDEDLNKGGEDKNPLSAEGFNAVPATRMHGGVVVRGDIKREVLVNLAALRNLSTNEDIDKDSKEIQKTDRSQELRRYLLALALVCLSRQPEANLREGCLLRNPDPKRNRLTLVPFEGDDTPFDPISASEAEQLALSAAKDFFGADFDNKDRPDGQFETGVAEKFLRKEKADRDKIRRAGPVTNATIVAYENKKKGDPFKAAKDIMKELKPNLPKRKRGKNEHPEVIADFFTSLIEEMLRVQSDEQLPDEARNLANTIINSIAADQDTKATFEEVSKRMRDFKKPSDSQTSDSASQPTANDQA